MSAYQQLVDLIAAGTYPATPQVSIPFDIGSLGVVNEGTTEIVFISFDGQNDHGRLHPTYNPSAIWDRQSGTRKVWLRSTAGGAPVSANVMIEGA